MKNCLVFGTGTACTKRISNLFLGQINIIGFLDNDTKKQGERFYGFTIDSPEHVNDYTYDYIIVISSYFNDICSQLIKLGVVRDKIIDLQTFLTPYVSGRSSIVNNYIIYDNGYHTGIEIGGAMNPTILLDRRIQLMQLDFMQHTMNEEGYKDMELVKVDIIDDGETLSTIDNTSLDFIIACHMIEHCRNPIGTIRTFLSKLRAGGIVFLAIPDKRYTFDHVRNLTDFDHLILDDTNPSKEREYLDYCDSWGTEALSFTNFVEKGYSHFHYHVWDSNSFVDFMYRLQKYLNNSFTIEQVGNLDASETAIEIILVIKKVA